MRLASAALIGLGLLALSAAVTLHALPTGALAVVVGGIGAAVAIALLVLTAMTWRWHAQPDLDVNVIAAPVADIAAASHVDRDTVAAVS